jgi:hypothetical protein
MPKKTRRILLSTLALLSIAAGALVFANAPKNRATQTTKIALQPDSDGSVSASVKALNSAIPQGVSPLGPVQMIRFTVYDSGIFPAEAHAKAGTVAIFLEDVTGSSLGLTVDGAQGLALASIVRDVGRWRGSVRIVLAPGQYRISELGQAGHKAILVVEP